MSQSPTTEAGPASELRWCYHGALSQNAVLARLREKNDVTLPCTPLSHLAANSLVIPRIRRLGTWQYQALSALTQWGRTSRALCQLCHSHILQRAPVKERIPSPVRASHSSCAQQLPLATPLLRTSTAASQQQEQAYRRHLRASWRPPSSQVPHRFLPSLLFPFSPQHTFFASYHLCIPTPVDALISSQRWDRRKTGK
ncbi:hypothetical protein VTI74DRAFT_629 [Chaetomium olivicolor]